MKIEDLRIGQEVKIEASGKIEEIKIDLITLRTKESRLIWVRTENLKEV